MPEGTHFPALEQLETEFNAHMDDFRTGIQTSEDYVYWLQETAVYTLGYLDDDVFIDLFTDPGIPNAVLLGYPAIKPYRNPEKTPLEKDTDVLVREEIEAQVLTPAYRRAYSDLKQNANEYLDDAPSGSLDDSAPALRPAIKELSSRQVGVLDDFFQEGGFDSQHELAKLSRDVVASTRGYISDDLVHALTSRVRGPTFTKALAADGTFDEGTRQNFLQMFAACRLLPRFNQAIRDLGQSAGEKAEDNIKSSGDTVDV